MFHFNNTTAVIVINVVLYFVSTSNHALLGRMLFINKRVRQFREYDRLLISGFAHASPLHLLFNMMTLYFFGPAVESNYGALQFMVIFLASIIGGNLFTMLTHREEPDYSALGASGGLFGVVYAFIWMFPDARLSLMLIPVWIPGWLFAILITGISLLLTQLPKAQQARISHEGHMGGALTGGLLALALYQPEFLHDELYYFIGGGLAPVVVFALVKWLAPGFLYRHRRRF